MYGYSYDQLNRLTAMNAYTGLSTGNNSFVPVGSTNYKERVSYDGNGNILSYLRNRAGVGVDTSMDKLSYTYAYDGDGFLVKNRLKQVSDAVVSTPAGTGDLPTGQASDNYGYDAIGNLVKDESEGIASGGIEWTVYGKISQVTKTNSGVTTVIKYTYDATGNRIGKWVQVGAGTPKQTAYVRDASGNVMAIYEKGNSEVNGGLLSQIEVPLYGSSRLGVWRPDREVETTGWELFDTDPMTGTGGGIAGGWERGRVQFELSNHLGNVLVTISDARTAVDDGTYQVLTACPTCLPGFACLPCYDVYIKQNSTPDGVVDYYLPQVLTANDYYPFGMIMPGRKYSEGNYRYGFNGKENDNDVKGEGNQQDYGMRIYDPRLGRFLSVDPLTEDYPWYTPYQFAGNDVIRNVDLDGGEPRPANTDRGSVEGAQRETSEYVTKNCARCNGGLVEKKTQTWNWHAGGLRTGTDKVTEAGWYSNAEYFNLLEGTDAALELASEAKYFSGWLGSTTNRGEIKYFLGRGTNENARNFLSGAAFSRATKHNRYTSGYTESSSFNVEDMLGLGLAAKAILSKFTFKKLSFYSVQGADDYARLLKGGSPWPISPQRAHLGPGLYAWGTKEQAQAYLTLLTSKKIDFSVQIVEFSITRSKYNKLKTFVVPLKDELANPWLEKHSFLYGQGLPHGYDQVIRGTGNFGVEHYFSKDAFRFFKIKK